MKLKKLLAAVLVAVMALTVAPLAASADATVPADSTLSISVGGTSVSGWDLKTSGTGTTAASPLVGTVNITYAQAQTGGIALSYTVPSGATAKLGTSQDPSDSTYPASGGTADNLITAKTENTTNIFYVTVVGTSNTTYYQVNVKTGPATRYNVTISGGTGNEAGTAQVTLPTSGSANKVVSAKQGDTITLDAPAKNKNNSDFSYWRISPSVEVTNASTLSSSGATINIGSFTDTSKTDAFKFIMPAQAVTATAIYQDGKGFSGGSAGNNNNVSGNGTVPVYFSGTTYDGLTYMNAGDSMTLYASNYYNYDYNYANVNWTVSPAGAGSFSSYNSPTTTFYLNTNYYGTVYVYAYGGQHTVTMRSVTGGSASARVNNSSTSTTSTTANTGDTITLTASASGSTTGYDYADPYYQYYGYGTGYNYQTYYYSFSSWSFSTAVTYATGYSATSNPTTIIMPNTDLVVTPSFTYSSSGSAYNPYYPGLYYPGYNTGTSSSSTSTTYTSGTASSTIVSGGVIAGVNASGSLNSTSTINAIEAGIQRGLLTGSTITVTLPEETTAISKATMEKLLRAAGGKSLRIKMDTDYGTIVIPVTSAKQIRTGIVGNNSTIRSAVALFEKTYGNDDVVGVQTTQASTFGFSATYRFDAGAVGVNADYGDRVYVAIYNPSTKKFSRKTVTVNASGEIAFASSYSGVILFSTEPFTK